MFKLRICLALNIADVCLRLLVSLNLETISPTTKVHGHLINLVLKHPPFMTCLSSQRSGAGLMAGIVVVWFPPCDTWWGRLLGKCLHVVQLDCFIDYVFQCQKFKGWKSQERVKYQGIPWRPKGKERSNFVSESMNNYFGTQIPFDLAVLKVVHLCTLLSK